MTVLGNPTAALLASLSLGFSRLFWRYSEGAEVFALNNCLVALLLYLFVLWRHVAVDLEQRTRYARAFWLAYGLSLSNHHTSALLLPAFGLGLWLTRSRPRNRWGSWLRGVLRCGLFLLLGLSLYLYAPLAALPDPVANWDNPVTAGNLERLVLRGDYGTLSLLAAPGGLQCRASPGQLGFVLSVHGGAGRLDRGGVGGPGIADGDS